jgi:hypothetical protein
MRLRLTRERVVGLFDDPDTPTSRFGKPIDADVRRHLGPCYDYRVTRWPGPDQEPAQEGDELTDLAQPRYLILVTRSVAKARFAYKESTVGQRFTGLSALLTKLQPERKYCLECGMCIGRIRIMVSDSLLLLRVPRAVYYYIYMSSD